MVGFTGILLAYSAVTAVFLFKRVNAFNLAGKKTLSIVSTTIPTFQANKRRHRETKLFGVFKFVKDLLSKDDPREEEPKLPLMSTAPEDPVSKDRRLFARHNPTEEGGY
jgi:hypothetical protein